MKWILLHWTHIPEYLPIHHCHRLILLLLNITYYSITSLLLNSYLTPWHYVIPVNITNHDIIQLLLNITYHGVRSLLLSITYHGAITLPLNNTYHRNISFLLNITDHGVLSLLLHITTKRNQFFLSCKLQFEQSNHWLTLAPSYLIFHSKKITCEILWTTAHGINHQFDLLARSQHAPDTLPEAAVTRHYPHWREVTLCHWTDKQKALEMAKGKGEGRRQCQQLSANSLPSWISLTAHVYNKQHTLFS